MCFFVFCFLWVFKMTFCICSLDARVSVCVCECTRTREWYFLNSKKLWVNLFNSTAKVFTTTDSRNKIPAMPGGKIPRHWNAWLGMDPTGPLDYPPLFINKCVFVYFDMFMWNCICVTVLVCECGCLLASVSVCGERCILCK